MSPGDSRQFAPATERNRDPILQVLKTVLPAQGGVLEVASGTGQHAAYFAPRLAPRYWLPSDPNPLARDSIRAWSATISAHNLLPPLALDVATRLWPVESKEFSQSPSAVVQPITAIVNINMIHISPWEACLGLLAGAGRILPAQGILYLYGPFKQQEQQAAPSNQAFDQRLRQQNPEWGIRYLEEVIAAATQQQLRLAQVKAMPANNLSVVFRHL